MQSLETLLADFDLGVSVTADVSKEKEFALKNFVSLYFWFSLIHSEYPYVFGSTFFVSYIPNPIL